MKLANLPTPDPSLVFPKPPFRMETSVLESPPADSIVTAYLQQIRDWRGAVKAFLRGSGVVEWISSHALSQRARLAFEIFLSTSWSENMTRYAIQSAYSLAPFPATALESAPAPDVKTVLQVLRWRAGTIDYLDDVWDVVDEPYLDLEECIVIGRFLGPSQKSVCHLCLTEFAGKRVHPDLHRCVLLQHVRAKWPSIPIFERWKNEVSRAQET